MPLRTVSEMMREPDPPKRRVYLHDRVMMVLPDDEPVLTVEALGVIFMENPELAAPGQRNVYEVERLNLGNGTVVVTYQVFHYEVDDAA